MLPSASMMKPLPAPRRGVSRSRGVPKSNGPSNGSGASGEPLRPRRRRVSRPRVVASMLTTAGLMRSTTSAKLTGGASAGALPAARRGATAAGGLGRRAGRDRRPRDAAGEDRPDQERDEGGERDA